eukprot:1159166-Pelagomonas_calceolata.AAC.4
MTAPTLAPAPALYAASQAPAAVAEPEPRWGGWPRVMDRRLSKGTGPLLWLLFAARRERH